MTPFTRRNLLIPVSAVFFTGLLYALNAIVPALRDHLQHLEFIAISIMIMMSVVIMFFWVLLGVFGGLTSFLVAMIFLYGPLTDLNPYYYGVLLVAFFMSSFIGYYVYRKNSLADQKNTVMLEKIHEDTNLISNHMKSRREEVSAMGEKIGSLLKLKKIADKLSASLADEEIIKIISEETFRIFGENDRVLLFMVAKPDGNLNLSSRLKGTGRKVFAMKNGGIFDRWVVKNMKSLLVKDIKKDFRFSVSGEETEDDSTSLIIKPLIIENEVLGILRVDSTRENRFGQYELRILDITGELAAVALENARLYRRTEELAIRDSLTGLYVHRYFMERLELEVQRASRSDISFALLMMDIDNFKNFNDEHGHVLGDAILRDIGRILKSKASAGDIVARYGGEEFVFLALNCKRKKAVKLANDIRKEIQDSVVMLRRRKYSVRISIGVAIFPEDAKLKEDIIWEADRYLYKAKEKKGKNTVCSK